jgi:hypothetical protein
MNTMSNKTHTIVVLADGETWTTLSGCSILVINDKQFDDLCNDRIDANDLKPIAEVGLSDATPPAYDEEIDLDGEEND